jgi:hypothetical protein
MGNIRGLVDRKLLESNLYRNLRGSEHLVLALATLQDHLDYRADSSQFTHRSPILHRRNDNHYDS